MHEKWRVKPPVYDLLARHFLARGLAKHPDVGKHIASVDDLERMPMMRLMTLAKVMGVDTDALIVGTEEDERARQRYCDEKSWFLWCDRIRPDGGDGREAGHPQGPGQVRLHAALALLREKEAGCLRGLARVVDERRVPNRAP